MNRLRVRHCLIFGLIMTPARLYSAEPARTTYYGHRVAFHGDLNKVIQFFSDAANEVLIGASEGGAPAAPAIIREALSRGANVNAFDSQGRTPLMIAAINGHYHVVEELLKNADINKTGSDGHFNPLFMAITNNNPDIVRLLVSRPDINLHIRNGFNRRTPLQDAMSNRDIFTGDSEQFRRADRIVQIIQEKLASAGTASAGK
jgi:Ankyrin repeats (3 copies)